MCAKLERAFVLRGRWEPRWLGKWLWEQIHIDSTGCGERGSALIRDRRRQVSWRDFERDITESIGRGAELATVFESRASCRKRLHIQTLVFALETLAHFFTGRCSPGVSLSPGPQPGAAGTLHRNGRSCSTGTSTSTNGSTKMRPIGAGSGCYFKY
jgi:hypothetical protein